MKKYDVTALGELLIDFTSNGESTQRNPIMEANPGGAPCNVLAMLSKLGKNTAFIGKVGEDMFGKMLREAIKSVGIDDSGLINDPTTNTTLAFVHTKPDGDRDFSFYRNPGADMMLTKDDLNRELLENCKIFHFGTLSMTSENGYEATKEAINIAKKAGAIISFDPNLREPLWNSLDEAKEKTLFGLEHCDILKISDNEIEWLTGEKDYEKAVEYLREKYDIPLILVSLGKDGSMAFSKSSHTKMPTFKVDTIETTGAGDTFCGCVLNYVLNKGLKDFNENELKNMLRFANAAAAYITTKKGALTKMPEEKDVIELIDKEKEKLLHEIETVHELVKKEDTLLQDNGVLEL